MLIVTLTIALLIAAGIAATKSIAMSLVFVVAAIGSSRFAKAGAAESFVAFLGLFVAAGFFVYLLA